MYAIQIITNAIANARKIPKNVASQRGRNPRWTYVPSISVGSTPDRRTASVYGRSSFAPNQMIRFGFSVVSTNAARPGSICTFPGRTSYDR